MMSRPRSAVTRVLFLLLFCAPSMLVADDWPEWRGVNRDGDWNETGIVSEFDNDSLKVVWRQPISSGYSGPTVANGLVYVMDRREVDQKQTERVLCFDEKTGQPIWQHEYESNYVNVGYPAGPRASVTIDGDRAYSVGTMGHIFCLNAKTGDVIWSVNGDQEYKLSASKRMPIWGIAGSPLVYDDKVIFHLGGAEGACLVAFDKLTGKESWRSLEDRCQYTSPILVKQNGKDVIVCWTGDSVAGVDPETGNVYWRQEFKPRQMPIGIATPIVSGDRIFVTSFYDGSMMLQMEPDMKVSEVWSACGANERSTKALHSIISTPVWIGDYIYGVDSYGEFRCLKAENGSRVWENLTAVPRSRWGTIHFVQNGDKTWMFNERVELLFGQLSPEGFQEISRAKLIDPTKKQLSSRNGVCWSHPAFANRCVFVRNDNEIKCISLATDE